ncbi:MAG: hypothetical protein K5930_10565 [Treponemataceae bacterium]|nr:hypothetical protein [Treponemataceae bacterium]
MTIAQAAQTIDAQILCNDQLQDLEVSSACGSDLMSDVMAFVKEQVLLLTGLINVQVIRTANLMDIGAICFVRGKQPTEEMVSMAKELGIILMATKLPLFPACGKLYSAGLTGYGVREI